MSIISQILGLVGSLAITITQTLGYPGVVFLMALESTAIPLPSELILPFAGFLSATGEFNIWFALIASIIGSLIGSLFSYWMGYYGGNKFVLAFGKYFFLDVADLAMTEEWFKKRGESVIFLARFVPVVRHLISIPAGIGKMDLKKFCLYTILGAGVWNAILLWAGFFLGSNWREIRNYSEYLSFLVAGLLVIATVIFIVRHARHQHFKNKIKL